MLKEVKMMPQIGLIVFCFLSVYPISAETNSLPQQSRPSGVNYFNRFQYFVYTKPDLDSALSCIRKLASDCESASALRFLLHNSFAQQFIPTNLITTVIADTIQSNNQRILCKEILSGMMSDTARLLLETARPIYLLSEIEDAENQPSKLKTLTKEFINTELLPNLFYTDKTGRYGLMIYRLVSKQSALKPLAKQLFGLIDTHLKNNQITLTDSSSRSELDERTWYRYLYAYVNYIKAEQSDDTNKKEYFLNIASNFSPDLIDRQHRNAYFYEMFFLLGKEKETFRDDYIKFLTNSYNGTTTVLPILSRAALADPSYKGELKTFYNRHNPSNRSFNDYWLEVVDSSAKKAPSIFLKQLDKETFSSKKLLGKWILIDFWGTWCGPCKKELPDVQKFYDSIVVRKSQYLSLLTIACKCTYADVVTYMKENNYTFPVAMSDSTIEDIYSLQSYPTKILITPKGRYIEIPFGIDWVDFIRQYIDL